MRHYYVFRSTATTLLLESVCSNIVGTIFIMGQSAATTDITFRVTAEDKELIKLAAEMENASVSDYVRSLAVRRAMELVTHLRLRETTEIPDDQFNALMASIDEPDTITPRMRRAYENLWKIELD